MSDQHRPYRSHSWFLRAKRSFARGCLVALLADTALGCFDAVRASLVIDSDSPLPKFIPVPPGRTPRDVEVKVFLFTSGATRILAVERGKGKVVLFSAIGTSDYKVMTCDGTRPKTMFTSVETGESSEACLGDIVLTYEGETIVLRRGNSANDLVVVGP